MIHQLPEVRLKAAEIVESWSQSRHRRPQNHCPEQPLDWTRMPQCKAEASLLVNIAHSWKFHEPGQWPKSFWHLNFKTLEALGSR